MFYKQLFNNYYLKYSKQYNHCHCSIVSILFRLVFYVCIHLVVLGHIFISRTQHCNTMCQYYWSTNRFNIIKIVLWKHESIYYNTCYYGFDMFIEYHTQVFSRFVGSRRCNRQCIVSDSIFLLRIILKTGFSWAN